MIPDNSIEKPLRLLLVDDEKDSCIYLQNILSTQRSTVVEIVGVAHNTGSAEQMIQLHKPDALLLDIEMPGENAFQFLKRLGTITFDIVFITAYNEYAVNAFQLNAVDYLLKPLYEEDLIKAVKRLVERKMYKQFLLHQGKQIDNLYEQIEHKATCRTIFLRNNNTLDAVASEDILYLEAMGSYCKVVFTKQKVVKQVVTSYSLSTYVNTFSEMFFYRIHKSYLINCASILEIKTGDKPAVTLMEGRDLPIGKRRLSSFIAFLKMHHPNK